MNEEIHPVGTGEELKNLRDMKAKLDKAATAFLWIGLGFLVLALFLWSEAHAGTAFLKHQYVSGQNRICVYDYMGSDYTVTVRSTQMCRLSINVNR